MAATDRNGIADLLVQAGRDAGEADISVSPASGTPKLPVKVILRNPPDKTPTGNGIQILATLGGFALVMLLVSLGAEKATDLVKLWLTRKAPPQPPLQELLGLTLKDLVSADPKTLQRIAVLLNPKLASDRPDHDRLLAEAGLLSSVLARGARISSQAAQAVSHALEAVGPLPDPTVNTDQLRAATMDAADQIESLVPGVMAAAEVLRGNGIEAQSPLAAAEAATVINVVTQSGLALAHSRSAIVPTAPLSTVTAEASQAVAAATAAQYAVEALSPTVNNVDSDQLLLKIHTTDAARRKKLSRDAQRWRLVSLAWGAVLAPAFHVNALDLLAPLLPGTVTRSITALGLHGFVGYGLVAFGVSAGAPFWQDYLDKLTALKKATEAKAAAPVAMPSLSVPAPTSASGNSLLQGSTGVK